MQAALVALSNIGSGDVLVEQVAVEGNERSWRITFGGSLAGTNVSQVEIDAALVDDGVGPPSETETTDTEGDGGNEEQVVTLSDATGGTFTLGFGGQTTAALDWDATTGEVDTALEALSGSGTISVSGSAGGPYTITFTGAYGKQDIAPLVARANNLTNADLVRTIAYTFNGDGDLAEVDDPAATYEFTYDDLGRVTDYVQNIVGLNPEIEFESSYDSAGRREVLQAIVDTDDDFKNVYAYDDLLRLTSLTQQEELGGNAVAPKRMEFNYNALGQYTRIDRYAATTATKFVASSHYSYDNLGRLLKLVHAETTTTPTGWGTDPLAGYQYTYDAGSRILSIDSYVDGLTEYAHDDTNQLVGADHNTAGDESYEYDANGNRVMSGYSVGTNNQLSSDGIYTYTYDYEGNRETRTKISNGYVTRYEWDFRNRLTKVTEEDDSSNVLQVTEQTYDAFNQWIRREFDDDGPGVNAAADTFFVYENGQIVLEFDGPAAADLSHRYTWGEQVDQFFGDESVSSLSSTGPVIWGLGDHLGTLRDLATYNSGTDDTSIANHREYNSYGVITNDTNATFELIFGFTSRPLDETTGSQNNLQRWYEAPNGIWLSVDPIGFAGGDRNLCRYVGNNIIQLLDPDGLQPFDPTEFWVVEPTYTESPKPWPSFSAKFEVDVLVNPLLKGAKWHMFNHSEVHVYDANYDLMGARLTTINDLAAAPQANESFKDEMFVPVKSFADLLTGITGKKACFVTLYLFKKFQLADTITYDNLDVTGVYDGSQGSGMATRAMRILGATRPDGSEYRWRRTDGFLHGEAGVTRSISASGVRLAGAIEVKASYDINGRMGNYEVNAWAISGDLNMSSMKVAARDFFF